MIRITHDTSKYVTNHSFILVLMRRCIVLLEYVNPLHVLLIQLFRNVFTFHLRLFSAGITLIIYKINNSINIVNVVIITVITYLYFDGKRKVNLMRP